VMTYHDRLGWSNRVKHSERADGIQDSTTCIANDCRFYVELV